MCGIVAVVRRPSQRPAPSPDQVVGGLDDALLRLGPPDVAGAAERLAACADRLHEVDALLRGVAGVEALLGHRALDSAVRAKLASLHGVVARLEQAVDTAAADLDPAELEAINAQLIRVKDGAWMIGCDRLRTAAEVSALAGRDPSRAAIEGFTSIQLALSAIDRLEVRGRDSAGIHVLVTGHGLDLDSPDVQALLGGRTDDPLFRSTGVRTPDGHLAFVYKAAAEIGELGDNVKAMRAAIAADPLLALALDSPTAHVTVLSHTRWASVGIISEANAHPLNHEEVGRSHGPYVVGVLNGDVDNHADLRAAEGLCVADEITTDAKVIPALVSRRLADGHDLVEAFRRTVVTFEGSVAIAAHAASRPELMVLAQRGSGQALYVGLAEDAFIVASEPYGVVEETNRYVRMDGERGEVFVLDATRAGELDGIRRLGYDGQERPFDPSEVTVAEITTRDIDRGDAPHFLLKEITEAPQSFRKTLRGRLRTGADGRLETSLGERVIPAGLAAALADGTIRRVVVIGQGTAAVAGQSAARLLRDLTEGTGLRVEATTATELSGFGMPASMADTLVVAVSQSGTTTDTNRTVDLCRQRGAWVVGIVNRRGSDLTDKSHGVLYTSDGRDVEMSVASTKAFYSQVAAGALLACAIAEQLGAHGAAGRVRRAELLEALRTLPDAMSAVLARRDEIAAAAQHFAPHRRYWAVVGNGPNVVAAEEVRIKLSELCYKSIACDVTEDKKHIDLSSEPLILVCAAGLTGGTADDVAKEVAIYKAHKAAPIVIASEGEERFHAALQVISVPAVDPAVAFVLSAMAGHLFGYETALAIDAQARPLREARAAIEEAVRSHVTGDALLARLEGPLTPVAQRFGDLLRSGALDGHLEASAAVRLALLLRFATGALPLEAYQLESGKVGTPEAVVDDLTGALTKAIEQLTRPIDAIKHQAKTVTVGISRSDEGLMAVPLVQAVLDAGAPRDRLTYRNLKVLADLDPAVVAVTGSTRYAIDGDPESEEARITRIDSSGVGRAVPSRTDTNPVLRGTKRRVALEREVLAARGRSDGRTLVIVPEVKGNQTTGITLLHVRFADRLDAATARAVLQGYGDRYDRLHDAVTETEPTFRDDLLADVDVVDLLTEPVQVLADRWRS